MYPKHCGAAVAVQNGEHVVGSATDVIDRAYISLINGDYTTNGYAKRVNAFRKLVQYRISSKITTAFDTKIIKIMCHRA